MSRLSTRSEVERALSSHSLKSLDIARRIVAHSGLAPPLAVYEIGPGSGLLTAALAECTGRVIAIEHDRAAWALLRERFRDDPRVQAVLGDFLKCPLPRRGDYAVAGNIPFARTSAVMRHILGAPNPPRSSILVMQREAALRWSGAVRESEISVLAKTASPSNSASPFADATSSQRRASNASLSRSRASRSPASTAPRNAPSRRSSRAASVEGAAR